MTYNSLTEILDAHSIPYETNTDGEVVSVEPATAEQEAIVLRIEEDGEIYKIMED